MIKIGMIKDIEHSDYWVGESSFYLKPGQLVEIYRVALASYAVFANMGDSVTELGWLVSKESIEIIGTL